MMAGSEREHDLILHLLVEQAVLSRPGGVELTPAAGGLNSRVLFVRQRGRTPFYTLRLALPGHEGLLRREAEILNALEANCDCAPESVRLLAHPDLAGGLLLVHAYVEGSSAPLGSVSDARLRSLGACLAGIHAHTSDHYAIWPGLEPAAGSRAEAFLDRLAAMRRYRTFSHSPGSPMWQRIERLYASLAGIEPHGAGWADTRFSVLHGDVSVGNIIWHGDQVALIDWEYARHGDPAEEIAYLLTEQPLEPQPTTTLFRSYVDAGGDASALDRAVIYAPLTALDSALWWGDYHLRNGSDPASSNEAPMHLARAEAAFQALPPTG